MAKFTFPVPGRRHRQGAAPDGNPTTPLTKAQKILGADGTLNVDMPKHWETGSVSGISVTVSESTAASGYTMGAKSERRTEAATSRKDAAGGVAWEGESHTGTFRLKSVVMGREQAQGQSRDGAERMESSEFAGTRQRRQSAASLQSWYDKTKLPLSISQQTSASAMAKGLPSKANTLLDMDNTISPSVPKRRRPGFLDLSLLLPRSRSSIAPGQTLDSVATAPAMVSPPAASPPVVKQRANREVRKKRTVETLREAASKGGSASRPGTSSSNRKGATEISDLQNLYEHYEKMSFRSCPDVAERGEGDAADDTAQTPVAKPAQHGVAKDSASISSRQTRASRTSRRTNHSLVDVDLQQNSVLSLSSDSEDEPSSGEVTPPRKSSNSSRQTDQSDEAMDSVPPMAKHHLHSNGTSLAKGGKRASFAAQNGYLGVPGQIRAPALAPRTSSLAHNQIYGRVQPTVSSSRLSVMSTSTAASSSSWNSRPGSVQEARAITIYPPPHVMTRNRQPASENFSLASSRPGSTRPSRASSTSSVSRSGTPSQQQQQPTPPLSPASVDFHLQNNTEPKPSAPNPRFMAVTRQEELLLAALRQKRASMRESILQEFEDERSESNSTPVGGMSRSSMATLTEANFEMPADALGVTHLQVRAEDQRSQRDSAISAGTGTSRPDDAGRDASSLKSKKSSPKQGKEQVLLFLDQPVRDISEIDASEPSPDLSDFMDFDDGTSDSEELASDEFFFPRARGTSTSRRHDLVGERTSSAKKTGDAAVRVVEAEEGLGGVPRPDSPVSPHAPSHAEKDRKKAVRISAVGRVGMEAGWWGDDG